MPLVVEQELEPFGARLSRAVRVRGPLCVGIDPHPSLLTAWGLDDDPAGLDRFSRTVVEALAGRVAIAKPQSAFYERFGSRGIAVLESTIRQLRTAGVLVLLDVKRGDIGSTIQAYADAYLDPSSPIAVDAITATPYLGFGSMRPLIDTAQRCGSGVFVVTRTSNPEGRTIQLAETFDGRTVSDLILDEIAQVNQGVDGWGSVGAVIGANLSDIGYELSKVNGPILAPGMGEQGGKLADLPGRFGASLPRVLPSYSREVLSNGPDPARLADAVARLADDCAQVHAAGVPIST